MKVKLPIFWNTDETSLFENLNIPLSDPDDFDGYEQRDITFYHIDAIFKYEGKDKHTTILCGSDKFICAFPFDKVEKLIDDANTQGSK